MIPYRNGGRTKNNPTETVGRTGLQWLEYYDFIDFTNPLSGISSPVVDGPPFLPLAW